jgi:hypothetical protein
MNRERPAVVEDVEVHCAAPRLMALEGHHDRLATSADREVEEAVLSEDLLDGESLG